ncbi:MAG: TonB-dependent receptor [Pseudomonadota bacterium]
MSDISVIRMRRRPALMASAAVLAIIVQSGPVFAQDLRTPIDYAIPAGALADSLDAVAKQAGVTLSYKSTETQGRQARPLNGTMTPAEALTRLIAGTGLRLEQLGAATAAVTSEAAAVAMVSQDDVIELDPLTLDGRDDSASGTRTLGTPPPAFPGGQVAEGSRFGLLGNRDVLDTPVSVTSYTDEFVRNTQAESPADILRFEPGANISQSTTGRGSFADSQSSIRGFTVFSGQATIDGLPGLLGGEVDAITAFERVEVIRGASALLTGQVSDDAIGGSINFVPKRPLDEPLNRVAFSYRSDANFGGEIDISRRFGADDQLGFRFIGQIRDGETSVEESDQEVGDLALALDYRGDRTRATLDIAFESRESTFDLLAFASGFTDIPGPPDTEEFVTPFPGIIDAETTRILGTVEHDIAPNWTLGLKAGFSDSEFLFNQVVVPFVGDASGDYAAGTFFLEDETEAFATEASVRGEFDTGPFNHQLAFTATYQFEELTAFAGDFIDLGPNNIFDPILLDPPPSNITPGSLTSVTETEITNIAIADYVSFLDGRVSLLAGVRFTNIDIESVTAAGVTAASFDDSDFTPAFGLAVKPFDNLTLYANFIEALIPGDSAPDVAVNPDEVLPPITSEQIEFGAKYDFERFAATVAAFEIERPSGILDSSGVFSEGGLQRNRGIEISAFGEPVEGFRFIGSAAFIDSEFVSAADETIEGNEAPGVPDFTFSAAAEIDIPQVEGLTLTGAAFFTSSSFLDDANTQRVPSFETFDVGARYEREIAGVPVTARLSVENVANSEHFISNPIGGGFATPSTPRRFLFTVSADF